MPASSYGTQQNVPYVCTRAGRGQVQVNFQPRNEGENAFVKTGRYGKNDIKTPSERKSFDMDYLSGHTHYLLAVACMTPACEGKV